MFVLIKHETVHSLRIYSENVVFFFRNRRILNFLLSRCVFFFVYQTFRYHRHLLFVERLENKAQEMH